MAKEQPIILEFGAEESDDCHEVVRAFLLKTKDGPLQSIPKEAIVRLKRETALEMFYAGKTIPLNIPETFEVLQSIRVEGPDGLWIRAQPGDIVRLDKTEAVRLLRERMVRLKEEE